MEKTAALMYQGRRYLQAHKSNMQRFLNYRFPPVKLKKPNEDKECNHILRLASILEPYESFLGWICKPKLHGDFKARLIISSNLPCQPQNLKCN